MAKDNLSEYSAKRTFDATPEPPAALAQGRSGPLLFVVQQHRARQLHYDLRLECDGVLKSWAVPRGPSLDPSEKRLAMLTEDHPYDYGSFEGVIPPGQYGAGEVIVWDCGVYSPDEGNVTWFHDRDRAEREVRDGLAKGKLSFQLRGEKVKGSFALVRTKDPKQWLVIKHKDRFVTAEDMTARSRSVLSGVTVEDLKVVPAHRIPASRLIPAGEIGAMPATLAPMQAESADAPFDHRDWMWEPKLDGYRILVFIGEGGVRMRSRRGLELSGDFPRLAEELAKHGPPGTILDGEIVAFDAAGKPSFNAMQNRASKVPVVFYAFDMTHFAGIDLRKSAYRDRRRYLAQCLLPSALVQLVHASPDGVELHSAALATGFEGVVGKRLDGRYESGKRSGSWLKVKSTRSADFVVGGYTQGSGLRSDMGALLVGYWDDGKLRYASHVGSGFDGKTLDRVKARLVPLKRKSNPFSEKPELNAPTTWTEPELVAEVSFQSWTEDGHLRSPVFLRLRDDIDPKDVRREPMTLSPALSHGGRNRSPTLSPALLKGEGEATKSLPSSTTQRPTSRWRSERTASASRTSTASIGPPIRRCSRQRSPSATCCAISRRSRPSSCRTSPIVRSP